MTNGIELHAQAPAAAGADLGFRLAAQINGQPMAMRERELSLLVQAIASNRFTLPRNRRTGARITEKGTAIVELHGILIDRLPFMGSFWGVNSYEGLAEQFRRLATNDDVKRIVLDVDSPGGMVTGIRACADELAKLASLKPVHALANNMACSAGYWLACVAEELSVMPDGEVGSIGVRSGHVSYAEALDRDGVAVTIFKAGSTKADLNPYALLDDGAAAEAQYDIERAYDRFCAHVSEHRPMTAEEARATDARCFVGERAVAAKLADRVETLEELIERVEKAAAKVKPKRKAAAETGSKAGLAPAERKPVPTREPDDTAPSARNMTKGAKRMTTPNAAAEENDILTQIASAVAALPKTASKPGAAPEPTRAEIEAAAATAERERIFAILDDAEAADRPKLARALAKAGMAVDGAKGILAASAKETAPAAAAESNPLSAAMKAAGNSGQVKPEAVVAEQKARPTFAEVAASK